VHIGQMTPFAGRTLIDQQTICGQTIETIVNSMLQCQDGPIHQRWSSSQLGVG
jgi:hypothetical protein